MTVAYVSSHGSTWVTLVVLAVVMVLRFSSARRRRSGKRAGATPPSSAPVVPTTSEFAGDPPGTTPEQTATPSPPGPTSAAGAIAPGWLRDPFFRHQYRWWSGAGWTDQVSDDGVLSTEVPPPPKR